MTGAASRPTCNEKEAPTFHGKPHLQRLALSMVERGTSNSCNPMISLGSQVFLCAVNRMQSKAIRGVDADGQHGSCGQDRGLLLSLDGAKESGHRRNVLQVKTRHSGQIGHINGIAQL
jgi:hypothetical protein